VTARYPNPSFAIDAEGNLFSVDGIRNAKRWDGYASGFVDAGVPAPSTAVVVGGSSTGTIVGERYAYQVWYDSAGRVSNVCPISNAYDAGGTPVSITGATNATPIVITAASHGFSNGDTVKITDVGGNYAANGTWVVANQTMNTFELTGSAGVADYTSGGSVVRGRGQLDYTSVDAPTDSRVATRKIIRNKDGNTAVFYIDVTLPNLTDTSISSTNTDAQLGDEFVLIDSDGNDFNLTANAEPPNWKRYIAQHYGRLWMAGSTEYKEGAVALTNGSSTVTGLGTGWTSAMVGWTFYPRGASNTTTYVVSTVNTSAQTMTLTANYGGSTDPYTYYALKPGADEERTIYYSKSAQPDSFNLTNALTVSSDENIGRLTGLMPMGSQLYVLFENRTFRITYQNEPIDDGFIFKASARGCVNNNCWVLTDDAAYMMDRRGFWVMQGNQTEPIGLNVQPLFHATRGLRIHWANTEHFHAVHDPLAECVKWFVCLGTTRYPKHAIVYHYRHQRWWVEEYSVPICSSTLGRLNGAPQVFLGSECRRILTPGGTLDGARHENGTVSGTVTSGGLLTLTDSAASFHTTKLVGAPVRIVAGTGAGQARIIISATATVLTLDQPWNVTPDTTSRYQIGGVKCTYRTGRYRFVQTGRDEKRGLELSMRPTDDGYLCVRKYLDRSTTAVDAEFTRPSDDGDGIATTDGATELEVDVTKASGFFQTNNDGFLEFRVDGPRHAQVELEFVPDSEALEISSLNLHGVGGRR
jgi:hypothetical protein